MHPVNSLSTNLLSIVTNFHGHPITAKETISKWWWISRLQIMSCFYSPNRRRLQVQHPSSAAGSWRLKFRIHSTQKREVGLEECGDSSPVLMATGNPANSPVEVGSYPYLLRLDSNLVWSNSSGSITRVFGAHMVVKIKGNWTPAISGWFVG